ncbi:MAG: PAN domain-containing protein [Pseudomonadota bacterium]
MRLLSCFFALFLIVGPAAQAQTRTNTSDILRNLDNTFVRGGSFEKIEMRRGQRARCAETCQDNPICRGFNWRKGTNDRPPQCSLYHVISETAATPYFHAGIRRRTPPVFDGTREPDTELRGEVLKEITLPHPRPGMCRDACAFEDGCLAYTYVKPGRLGPDSPPTCRLMAKETERRVSACCVSGRQRDSFEAFRWRRDTRLQFAIEVPVNVADVRACVHLCSADATCRYAVYRKTSATRPVGLCTLSGNNPTSVVSDDGFSTYERAPPDHNMYNSRPGVRNTAPNYRRLRLDARNDADALSLCRAACGRDPECKAANLVPASNSSSARCNMKKTLATNVFDDCCTSNSKIPNSKPPSPPGPNTIPTRIRFSANDPGNVIAGDPYPADMPNVRYPVNWQGCSNDDRALIRRAWTRAHHNVWRARQVMSHLNAQPRRAAMWTWSFTDRMGTAPGYNNISPRGYFGSYDHGRFHDVRRVVDKLFVDRFRGKTFRIKCRVRDSDGAHPCETFNANANTSVYGTINLCQRWFDNGVFIDQVTILTHEMLHWMKIPKSAYWVTDRHDYWRSCRDYRGAKARYDDAAVWLGMNRGCKDWNHNRAVRANDTYAWWISTLGDRIYRGRLPQFPAEDF